MACVVEADLGVSFQAVEAETHKSRIGKFSFKIVFGHIQNPAEIKLGPVIEKSELFVFTYGGFRLVGTSEDTFITAEEMGSDFGGQVGRYFAFVFYCQIADTLIGIKLAIGTKRSCRTSIQALVAVRATSFDWLIGRQFEACYYFSKEELRTELGIYKHTIFTDEAEACASGENPFGDGGRVNANSESKACAGDGTYKIRQLSQLLFYKGVIVFVLSVVCHFAHRGGNVWQ